MSRSFSTPELVALVRMPGFAVGVLQLARLLDTAGVSIAEVAPKVLPRCAAVYFASALGRDLPMGDDLGTAAWPLPPACWEPCGPRAAIMRAAYFFALECIRVPDPDDARQAVVAHAGRVAFALQSLVMALDEAELAGLSEESKIELLRSVARKEHLFEEMMDGML